MIYIAGSGAMAEAANAMRRMQRRIDRRAARSKDRRKARRHRARAHELGLDIADYEPTRVEFSCVYLCSMCGYFVDDATPARDPDQDSGQDSAQDADQDSERTCPSCGDTEWLDLALEPIADGVRDMEAEERMKPPTRIKRLLFGSALGVILAIGAAIVIAGYMDRGTTLPSKYMGYLLVTGLIGAFVVPMVTFLLARPISVWLLSREERTPHRWHIPLPLPGPERSESRHLERLEARALDTTLTAPISGRECLAYQVCVLFDTPGDARPAEWVLQEQRAVGVRLGDDLEVSPEALYLESPVEQIDAPGGEAVLTTDLAMTKSGEEDDGRYAEVKRFLRQRGLFITDGEFLFYEARLEPGDLVDVADYDAEVYVLRHSSAAEPGELPQLPQPS